MTVPVELHPRPFVKWVGGKRSILLHLTKRVPSEFGRYIEPFVGGGALFFALQPPVAVLSDINERLMITYKAIQTDVDEVIGLLENLFAHHNKEQYLRVRESLGLEENPIRLAAYFLYLNRTCFNGVYRVNKAGKFNVPMGSYAKPPTVNTANLRQASTALKNASLLCADFSQITPQPKDFFYLDPPYHTSYDGYSGKRFDEESHADLALFCASIEESGGLFMLSNSDTALVRHLYRGYNIEEVSASRSVSRQGSARGRTSELLIRNYKDEK